MPAGNGFLHSGGVSHGDGIACIHGSHSTLGRQIVLLFCDDRVIKILELENSSVWFL